VNTRLLLQMKEAAELVMGISVDPREDLFDLGLTSSVAVAFQSRLRIMGVDVSLGAIFNGRSIEAICQDAHRGLPIFERQGGSPPSTPCVIVPISVFGAAEVVLSIPPLFGEPITFWDLDLTGADRDVVGVRSLGLEEGEAPLTSIADMAAYFVEVTENFLRSYDRAVILGYSMGGLIAAEMFCAFNAARPAIQLDLVVVDTTFPAFCATTLETSRRVRLDVLREEVMLRFGEPIAEEVDLEAIFSMLVSADLGYRRSAWPAFVRQQEVWAANLMAANAYVSRWIGGSATYAKASTNPTQAVEPWHGLFDELKVVDVSGDHESCIRSPELAHLILATGG
jgi:thioesterase domain-containing protein